MMACSGLRGCRVTLYHVPVWILTLISAPSVAYAVDPYSWDDCRDRFDSIRNGTIAEYSGVTQHNIGIFIYNGTPRGLDSSYPRDQYLLLTYEGCKRICGESTIVFNKTTSIVGILATWVFPLAILLGLPFESHHRHRIRRTLSAIGTWLGTPQTALTASIWNFRSTRECYRRARDAGLRQASWVDAYYLLSCFNQFELKVGSRGDQVRQMIGPEHGGDVNVDRLTDEEIFLQTLVYGLFRPLSNVSMRAHGHGDADEIPLRELPREAHGPLINDAARHEPNPRLTQHQRASLTAIEEVEIQLTTELLSALAFQIRMHRRRGVIPTLSSLATFLMAFVFSVVLAFGDLSDSTTIFVLDLGVFFSWLPVLVIFAVVDRNPISSERVANLMSRWLYITHNVRTWAQSARRSVLNPPPAGAAVPEVDPGNNDPTTPQDPIPTLDVAVRQVFWWDPSMPDRNALGQFQVGSYIGQGRTLEYCGLAAATVHSTMLRGSFSNWTPETPVHYARKISHRLRGRRPLAWHMTALTCLAIVWIEVGLATMADYITPTVGLGCWSLIFLIYGFLSSMSWFLQFLTLPSGQDRWDRVKRAMATWLSHTWNGIAVLWIILIVVLLASGVLNNCYCNSCMPGFTGAGGYTDLVSSFGFFRDNYGLTTPWIVAAVVGASIPTMALIVALWWWRTCKLLWAASELGGEGGLPARRQAAINMQWLGE
ncbi:hypothetical protein V8F06_005561 [Rhypophila decipiens]